MIEWQCPSAFISVALLHTCAITNTQTSAYLRWCKGAPAPKPGAPGRSPGAPGHETGELGPGCGLPYRA